MAGLGVRYVEDVAVKVWVVYLHYDMEGQSSPCGIFSTEQLAREYVERNDDKDPYGPNWVIDEYTLDETEEGGL